ncbi:MAG: AAA family ATPase [Burkholderiales bacterium]|nr:AAA family ATPase [Burkholderiales bacterium]
MPAAPQPLRFDRFVLDEANALFTHDGRSVRLEPKAFAVLCELVRQPGRLATKDALLDAVWGHRHVSESVLKSVISQLRSVLDDDAGRPRYIETVSRRGYRFVGRLEAPHPAPAGSGATTPAIPLTDGAAEQPLPPMIGRESELARLHACWQRARAGQRQLVWVEGDAGVGKTTLIDRFVAEAGGGLSARGQCVEQFGAGEPYLPLLEALDALVRRDAGRVAVMRQAAPTWLVQMPWLLTEADRVALRAELAGAGQERMVRELWELLARLTHDAPLVLVTEDLHWSDQGTLRLMDHFARQRNPLRLLWLTSFRLAQVIAEQHPLQALRGELRMHRLCEELLLDSFSETELGAYVESRVPGRAVAPAFVQSLHAHTDGLPLFVVSVIDGLLASDAGLPTRADGWARAGEQVLSVPDGLAGAIEGQLAKLPPGTSETLGAASVCGMEFRAATVAALLGQEPAAVASACDELVRRRSWLREAGFNALPDGGLDTKYAFRHAVYKHVFYQRLTASQRISAHRQAARALVQGRAAGVPATSAEIASHHELGLEPRAAISHYSAAAESALGHFAPQEAFQLTERALALLPDCPPGAETQEAELSLAASRGVAFSLLQGIAAPDTVAAFDRVRTLAELLPQTPARALLLNSIGWNLFTRGDYEGALAMTQRIEAISQSFDDPVLFVFACNLRGTTLANMGRFGEARRTLDDGLAVCVRDGERLPVQQLYVDPEASICANLVPPLLQLGLADQARTMAAHAMARTERRRQPMARLVAHWCGCLLGVRLDDIHTADGHTTQLEELVATTTIQQALAPARWFRGWVEMRRGRIEEGVALVREGVALYEQSGTLAGSTETLGYAVEGLVALRRWDEAQKVLERAIDLVERFGERLWMTELLLLRARIEAGRGDGDGERRAIEAALREARAAGALGAELRAAVALAERAARTAADLATLRQVHARVTEGFDTPLWARASALLDGAA